MLPRGGPIPVQTSVDQVLAIVGDPAARPGKAVQTSTFRSLLCNDGYRSARPVTPEVAGWSPVAPAFEVPATRALLVLKAPMALMRATVAGNVPPQERRPLSERPCRRGPWSQADRGQPVSRAQFKRGACDV